MTGTKNIIFKWRNYMISLSKPMFVYYTKNKQTLDSEHLCYATGRTLLTTFLLPLKVYVLIYSLSLFKK